jgi:hypothetical protein
MCIVVVRQTWVVQWLRLALSKGPNSLGFSLLIWGWNQMQFAKCCVLWFLNTGWWAKSKSPVILSTPEDVGWRSLWSILIHANLYFIWNLNQTSTYFSKNYSSYKLLAHDINTGISDIYNFYFWYFQYCVQLIKFMDIYILCFHAVCCLYCPLALTAI